MPRKPNTAKDHYNDPFPRALRALMDERGLVQNDLTKVLGVKSRQSLTGYLDGSTFPTGDKIVAVAKFFHVSADYLLGLAEEPTTDTDMQAVCKYTGLTEAGVSALQQISRLSKNRGSISTFLAEYGLEFNFGLLSILRGVESADAQLSQIADSIESELCPPIENLEKLCWLEKDLQVSLFCFSETCRDIPQIFGVDSVMSNIKDLQDRILQEASEQSQETGNLELQVDRMIQTLSVRSQEAEDGEHTED